MDAEHFPPKPVDRQRLHVLPIHKTAIILDARHAVTFLTVLSPGVTALAVPAETRLSSFRRMPERTTLTSSEIRDEIRG